MEEKKTSHLTRLLAAIGLIAAVIVVVVAIGAATSSKEESKGGKQNPTRQAQNQPKTNKKKYEVQEGDNLTIISQKTGISVDRLEALNPDLDPQALQPGQELQLR